MNDCRLWHLHLGSWCGLIAGTAIAFVAQFQEGACGFEGMPYGWPMVSHYSGRPISGPSHSYYELGKKLKWRTLPPKRWVVWPGLAFNVFFNAMMVGSIVAVCEDRFRTKQPWRQFRLRQIFWAMTFAGLFLAVSNPNDQSQLWCWFEYPTFNVYSRAWLGVYFRLPILVGNGCLVYVILQVALTLLYRAKGRVRMSAPRVAKPM